jgi:hypothetical protein
MRQALLGFFVLVTSLIVSLAQNTTVLAQTPQVSSESSTLTATDAAALSPTPPPPPPGMAFTLSPSILNLKVKPGESTSFQLKIRNNGESAEALEMAVNKLAPNPNQERPEFSEFDPEDPFPSWLTFTPQRFTVEAGAWQQVEGTITPPESALLGYYAGLVFKRQVNKVGPDGITEIAGAPAVIALFEVESNAAFPQLQLVSFIGPKWVEYLPATFQVEVVNSGNIHLQPFGNIFIDQGNTKDVGILTVNEKAGFVLPGGKRVFESQWSEGFPLIETVRNEDGSETKNVKWDFTKANWLRMGKFSATMLLAYNDGVRDVPLEASITFWVIPWKIILGILALLLILGLGIFTIAKPVLKAFKRAKPAKSDPESQQ